MDAMKPRPSSADLTQEDWLAWLHARHGFHEISWLALVDAYEAADRRDAELMLYAQQIASCGPCGIELYGIAFRGWDQAENGKLRGAL